MTPETREKKYGGNPTPDQVEQWRINNDLHEIDLVSILMVQKIIIQTETKSTSPETKELTQKGRIKDAIDQVKFFREYLIRMHLSEVDNFTFIPTIAFPNMKELPSSNKRSQCYCKNISLEEQGDAEQVTKSEEEECNTVKNFEALSIETKRKMEETEDGHEVDSCRDGPDKQIQGSIKSSEENLQSNGWSSRQDKDVEKKNGCSGGKRGNAQTLVASSSDDGTKTSFQTEEAVHKAATMFTIEEANTNEHDRGRGAWYLGKKYETCASTVQRQGCLFFKWDFEDGPVSQTRATVGASCLCGIEPLTISVPQRQKDKCAKRFQVCQAQGKRCEFFCWVDEPQRLDQSDNEESKGAETKTFFKGTCKKHFMFKQHVENTTELKEWWKQNFNPSTTCNVKDKQQDNLRGRLITTSSMVFTRLPRLLSKLTPDSQLILMRYCFTYFN